MWQRIALPRLPGQVQAVSEPFAERLIVWTTAGIFVIKLAPKVRLMERLTLARGLGRFDSADGSLRWRGIRYRMHGACGRAGAVVGEALPLTQRLGQHLERDGDRLFIRDIAGKVRQSIKGCDPEAPWSVAGFCGHWQEYLLVARPGFVRLFRFAGSAEGGGAAWQQGGNAADQQSFIRAMTENPDDDAVRLVYADWLEEHGDAYRAEFIRVQCRIGERERLADVPIGDPDEVRVRFLCNAHGDRWAAELPALPGVGYSSFHAAFRGFPLVSFRSAADLIRHSDRIHAVTPIEALYFARLPPTQLARLLPSPLFERICRLTIHALPAGAEAGLVAWLMSPRAARLRRLCLLNCVDWTAIVRAVAASRYLNRLEKLLLEDALAVAPDESAILALAHSPHLPRLRFVSFAWWHEYPERIKAELRQRFPSIPLK